MLNCSGPMLKRCVGPITVVWSPPAPFSNMTVWGAWLTKPARGREPIVIAWPDRPATVSPAKYSEANASIELAARPYKVRQDDTGEDE